MTGRLEIDEGAIEWLTALLLQTIARAEPVDPTSLLFLLHRYTATDRADLGDALGEALATALARGGAGDQGAGWLTLLSEASRVSDDMRLRTAATELGAALRERWRSAITVEAAAEAVESCLIFSRGMSSRDSFAAAVDELERLVGAAYRPGEGVGRFVGDPDRQRGCLGDQVSAASALLTAFALTGRLPYSMLAEELMQFARRTLWDDRGGGFFDGSEHKPFELNCRAARVLCRLEALHRDDDYRQAAVLATGGSYESAAMQTLAALTPDLRDRGLTAAAYGIALAEWMHLRGDLK